MRRVPLAILGLTALALAGLALAQTVQLKVFVGGQQRPDVMEELFAMYHARTTGVRVSLEVGGATSELQQQYLTTVLASRDAALDVFLIDVVRPAQYAAAGWAEPMDTYFPGPASLRSFLANYLPGPVEANTVDGKLYALPAFTDAQFLYYRQDLLDKYGFSAPRTWDELVQQAQVILRGESNPTLEGFSYVGAPIEGAVCTFLVPIWGQGADIVDAQGQVNVNTEAARRALQFWLDTVDRYRITRPNVGEIRTDDARQWFQAGNAVFSVNWAYAWAHFQGSSPQATMVKDKVGVAPVPAFGNNPSATCVGGWQWAVSAFSRNKLEAVRLIQFLTSPEAQIVLAVRAGNLPTRADLYDHPQVVSANPHFPLLRENVLGARGRPKTPNYPQVSEIIRTTTNAVLTKTKTIDQALIEMQAALQRVFR